MAKQDLLKSWLKDAYAMEQAQKQTLERALKNFDDYPGVKSAIEEHITTTERQAEDIKSCLEKLDDDTSTLKTVLGSVTGTVQGLAAAPFKDDAVKALLVMHADEHFEHACYLSLTAAARECGEEEIASTCERILHEELAMADTVAEHLPVITASVLRNEE